MKHYLKTLEETIRQQWDQKSLCDYEGDSFTYADVATSIEQFRIFLVEAGITKRSKIAICARNCARWAMIFWDINVNECVAVPLLADFHPNSITTFTHHSDSVLFFTDKEIWDKLNPGQMPNLRAAINVKDRSMLWYRDELVAEAWENREKAFAQKHPTGFTRAQVSYPSDNMDKLAIINYTSGTTGNPKGVMLTYGAISDTDAFSNSHFPNQPGETVVSMLPMAHMYGLAIEFIHPNVDGVTVYFLGKTPSPTTLLKAMQEVIRYANYSKTNGIAFAAVDSKQHSGRAKTLGAWKVTGMWIPPGPTNPRNLSLTMNPSMKEFPKGFTILMRVYGRPVMCVVMPIGVCLQAVAGTPMAIMPSCSSTDLSWPV